MHRTLFAGCGIALLAISLGAAAQEPAQRPFGFGNPPPSAELERLPQTPGAKGEIGRAHV